jgi:hypothetical protein
MPRTNKIIIRSGTAAPTASDFVTGEPAWDKTNGKFYVKNTAGTMVEIGAGGATEIYEYATTASFPAPGSAARIYIATDTSRAYRYDTTNSVYVELGAISAYDSRFDLLLPPAPTSVTATAGDTQATVSWSAPTVLSQTPITDYTLQRQPSGGSWTTVTRSASTATSATVTGLTNGTAYQFRVAAVNGIGTGSYSTASSSVTPVAGDPNFSSVRLLIHGETLADSSSAARTLTATGASISTTQKKFGSSSISIESGQYVSFPGNSALNMSGDFTLEWFHYLTSATAQGWIIGGDANSSGYFMLGVNLTGSQQLWIGQAAVGWPVQFGSVPLAANTWQHVAISRSGSSNRLYIDGTLVGSAITDSTSWTTNPNNIWIGSQSGGVSMAGYLDEFRWTVGTARGFTGSTITVPTAAYPDS